MKNNDFININNVVYYLKSYTLLQPSNIYNKINLMFNYVYKKL